MEVILNILNIIRNNRTIKEWLIAAVFIYCAANLAYRMAFYPGAVMSPLLFMAVLLVLIVWKPLIGTALYLFMYPLVPASESLNLAKVGIFALTGLILFLWWWQNIRIQHKPWLLPEYKWIYLFLIFTGLSPLLGMLNGFTIVDIARDLAPMLNLLLIPVLADYFKERQNRWLLYLVFIPVAFGMFRDIVVLLGRYGFPTIPFLRLVPYRLSAYHPSMVVGLGVVLFIQGVRKRWWWLILSIVAITVTLLTGTRTVWLSVAFVAALIWAYYSRHRFRAILLIIILLAVTAALLFSNTGNSTFLTSQAERYDLLVNYSSDLSFENRLDEISQMKALIVSSPLYGVGFGYQYSFWWHFVLQYGRSGTFSTNFCHNDILFILSKGGIIGFALFAAALFALFRRLSWRRKILKNKNEAAFAWITIAMIAILQALFVGLSTPVFQTREAAFFLAIIVALGLGYPEGSDHAATS